MTTSAVIKHFHVFEQVRDRFSMREIPRTMRTLFVLAAEEAFRRRISPITLAAHQVMRAVALKSVPEFLIGGLGNMVRKLKCARCSPAAQPCSRQCVGSTIRRHALFDRPTYSGSVL